MGDKITGLNGGVEIISLALDDKFAAVDVSDTTQAPTGTTKPLSLSTLQSYLQGNLSFLANGDVDLGYNVGSRAITNTAGDGVTLPLFTAVGAGLVPLSGGGTTNFLRADGTWAPAGGGNTLYSADDNLAGNRTVGLSDGVSTDYNLTFAGLTAPNLLKLNAQQDNVGIASDTLVGTTLNVGGKVQSSDNITIDADTSVTLTKGFELKNGLTSVASIRGSNTNAQPNSAALRLRSNGSDSILLASSTGSHIKNNLAIGGVIPVPLNLLHLETGSNPSIINGLSFFDNAPGLNNYIATFGTIAGTRAILRMNNAGIRTIELVSSSTSYVNNPLGFGIGTNTPLTNKALTVGGDTQINGDLTTSLTITASTYAKVFTLPFSGFAVFGHKDFTANADFAFAQDLSGNTIVNSPAASSTLFRKGNVTKMILNASDNFGIGATTPNSKLTVQGDIEMNQATNVFYLGDKSADGSWRIKQSGDDLVFEQREAGVWNTKNTISGA